MESLGIEAIISLVLAGLTLIVIFISHYVYVRGKLHKAAAGAITNAEQDDKTGEEKLEIAVDQVYSLVPTSLKVFIHRSSVRKIVQSAFDKIEDYAKKQVEKKSKKKECDDGSTGENNDSLEASGSKIIVSPPNDEMADSGGESEHPSNNESPQNAEDNWQEIDGMIPPNINAQAEIATTVNDDITPDEQSATQVKQSRACSINKNSIQEKIIMENNTTNDIQITKDEMDDIVELRTVNAKHYRNSNGSYSAVIFDGPVHYLDEQDHSYKEIDMTLESDNTRSFDGYKIRANRFGLKFAKTLSSQSLMVLEDPAGTIDISCNVSKNTVGRMLRNVGVTAKIDYADKKVSKLKKLLSRSSSATTSSATVEINPFNTVKKVKSVIEQRLEKCKKLASNIMYENAFVGADLEYVLSSNKIKENIIVGSRADKYEYAFTIRLDGFDMRLAADGSGIDIVSKSDNSVKYVIPAPFMYDANEERSDNVMLKLDKTSEGVFELEVVADKAWINSSERAFPVVIDPQIISRETSDITMRTYSDGTLIPSGDNLNALGRCYGTLYDMKVEIQTPNIVSKVFSNDTRVLNATVELTKAQDWRRADSLGFNVLKDGRVVDHFTYNGTNNRVDINITNELNAAIKGQTRTTVFDIQPIDRLSNTDDYMLLINETDANSEYRPKIMIDYVSDRLSLGASYHTSDVKRAGVGEVNLFNGNLTFTHTDLSASGSKLPFDLKHIYMSKLKGKEYDCEIYGSEERRLTPDFKMGKGWKMNIQQYLLKDEKDPTKVTYLDGKGEVQLFEEKYFYEVNGTRKFVKKEQCVENIDGTLSISIRENNEEKKYSVTHAFLTESGLLLFNDPNLKAIIAKSENRIIGTEYYVIYKGCKTPILIDKDHVTFTRYYYTKNTFYKSGATWAHDIYFAKDEVEKRGNKYYLKSDPTLELKELTLVYDIKKNSAKERFFTVSEFVEERIYHGGVNYYQRDENLYIRAQYQYENGEVESSVLIFNNEEIIALFDKAEELKSYLQDLETRKSSYEEEKANITNPSDIQKKLNAAIKNYNEKQADIESKSYQNSMELLNKRSQIAQANNSYNTKAAQNNILSYNHSSTYNNMTNGKEGYVFSGYENQLAYSTYELGRMQSNIANLNYNLESKSISNERYMLNMQKELGLLKNDVELYQKQKEETEIDKQLELLDLEIQKIDYQIEKYEVVLKDVKKQLDELIEIEKHNPIDYITDDSGRLGFDYYGHLVEISDNSDNKASIVYENENIKSITLSDEGVIRFEYYLGRLNKIFDTRQRMTLFEYNDNGFLSKIVYPDNQAVSFDGHYDNRITEFRYNQYNELEEARDQSGYAVKYTYNYFKQVEKVKCYTYTQEISTDSFVQSETPIDGDSVTIQYNNFKSTSVKNNHGVATTYVFDNAGRAVNIYRDDQFESEDRLNVTEAVNLSYKGRRKAYDVEVRQDAENYAQNPGFESGTTAWLDINDTATTHCSVVGTSFVGGRNALKIDGHPQQARYAKQIILAKDLPTGRNLIFAAWAKAQSAFIRSDRSSGYGDDIFENYNIDSFDDYKRNRKFGIRAVIKYSGYAPEAMETTFDWYNTAWQFASLPIRLLKDRTLESITLYLDYSNNINSVLFDNVQLIEGEGDYKEFYEDGKLRYSTDGKIDSFYPEYYNGMPTHVIRVDESDNRYVTEYAYDEKKRLVRSVNYNGIVTEYKYLSNGELDKTEMFHKDEPGTKFVSESRYDDKGKNIGEVDPRGEVDGKMLSTGLEYISGTNLLKESINAKGVKTTYAYDFANDNLLSVSKSNNGEDNSNQFEYKKGYMTRVYNDAADYGFGYDGFGREKSVKVNGEKYIDYTHTDNTDGSHSVRTDFANGETLTEYFDKLGNHTKTEYERNATTEVQAMPVRARNIIFNGVNIASDAASSATAQTIIENVYDINGRIIAYTDGLTGETHTFEYDKQQRMTAEGYMRSGVEITSRNEYDGKDNVVSATLNIGGESLSYSYGYDNSLEPKIKSTVMPNGIRSAVEYDKLGRNYENVVSDETGKTLLRSYTYYLKYGDHTTNFLSSVRYGVNGALDEHTKFTYDENGNILTVSENGRLSVRYAYDDLDRLVREDNVLLGKTYLYSYDNNGNILTKTECAYTLGDHPQGETHEYAYSIGKWKDLLLGFDGETCEYDPFGNATKYRNHSLTYSHCGNLRTFDGISFDYDASGKRVRKTVNGVSVEYINDGGTLVRQTDGNRAIDFFYDKSGLASIRINGTSYFIRKNPSGDVTHIYDMTGALKARYVYDAWGNHKVLNADGTEDDDLNSVGNVNPIRYRGYYYDTETGLYYLNSRYYDAEVGRFINADSISNVKECAEDIGGLNLFAYCFNNPVNAIDADGELSWWKKLLIGIAVIAVVAVVAVATAGTAVGAVAAAATVGAVKGAVIGAATGAAIGAVTGGIQGYQQNGWDGVLSGMGSGALNGMADGFMSGAITGAITGAASGIKSLNSTSKLMNGKATNIKPSDCFVAGTKILTEHGKKNIEDVKVGDKVWSWNDKTNKQELKPVVQLFRNNKRDMVYITVGGEKITTTTEHPFYVKGKGWVRAKNLVDSDMLVCYNGSTLKIDSVQIEYADHAVQTYNFEVEGNHNYYVGDASVLAHNQCVYRGGSDMTVRRCDVKMSADGLVQPKRGISVNSNIDAVRSFGQPHKIGALPDGLLLKNTSGTHFEIIPKYAMDLNTYQSLLNKITLIPM
ncbi:MAG: polymorphic toxin-type HINT domain-containing protein [Roseburia sp.]|nr:polymorphic toxin-type HINT domain-containing protein [Roseburia sp.]